jgi:hypothetical protein
MTVNIEQLGKAVHILLQKRELLQSAKEAWYKLRDAMNESEEKASYDRAKKEEMEAYTTLAEMAQEIFDETGEKDLHAAVQIRETTEYVVDWDAALDWCRTEMPAMLVVDRKAFMAYIKKSAKKLPDFVLQDTYGKPAIATDIAKAIKKAANEEVPF